MHRLSQTVDDGQSKQNCKIPSPLIQGETEKEVRSPTTHLETKIGTYRPLTYTWCRIELDLYLMEGEDVRIQIHCTWIT